MNSFRNQRLRDHALPMSAVWLFNDIAEAKGRQELFTRQWGYLGKGSFQRRDFRFDSLTLSSAFSAEDSLFAQLGNHEIFTPARTYPPMTVSELAAVAPEADEVSLTSRRAAP
jgi:hypothetical protein